MSLSNLKRNELLIKCEELKLKGYKTKTKPELIDLVLKYDNKLINNKELTDDKQIKKEETKINKKNKGQFYTTNNDYILDGLSIPNDIKDIIEPFAGKGDLIEWVLKQDKKNILAYDIEPKKEGIIKMDTLKNPPNYNGLWVITNPPYLARNKCEDKTIFDMYNTNDLYKCFIKSLTQKEKCNGGLIIIPAGFFFSPRNLDTECRNDFMKNYKIVQIKYFEETVFDDTTTTVVVILFEKSDVILTEQNVKWIFMPSGQEKIFNMTLNNDWIIGGDIYNLPTSNKIKISRHVENMELKNGEQQTFITLNALDSGTQNGRISLDYKKDYVYPAKDCSRTYATLRIHGIVLTEEQQKKVCEKFNIFIEKKREEFCSLFLPQFRESKEYARKRIPFELAYKIVGNIIMDL
jgi:hypothetical protein